MFKGKKRLEPAPEKSKRRRGRGCLQAGLLIFGLLVTFGVISNWINPPEQVQPLPDAVAGAGRSSEIDISAGSDAQTPTHTSTGMPTQTMTPTATPLPINTATGTALPTATPLPTTTATALPDVVIVADTVAPAAVASGAVAGGNANLRSGPGTDFAIVGGVVDGESLEIVGRNADGTWYQLANGHWVAAFLVEGAAASIPVAPVPDPLSQAVETAPVDEARTGSEGENDAAPTVEPTATPDISAAPPPNSGGGDENPNAFQCSGGCTEPPDPSCAIKGNVNSSGERIYHTTSSRSYSNTNVKLEEGDRWFCTEQEAADAGFRAPRN
jgi:hypothetical protein